MNESFVEKLILDITAIMARKMMDMNDNSPEFDDAFLRYIHMQRLLTILRG